MKIIKIVLLVTFILSLIPAVPVVAAGADEGTTKGATAVTADQDEGTAKGATEATADTEESAAEAPSEGRIIWDTVWRFINFFILAFVVVRYGKGPIKKFLGDHSADIGNRLDHYQGLVKEAQDEYREAEENLTKIQELMDDLQAYMKTEGEKIKQNMIREAELTSERIIADAKDRADTMTRTAMEEIKIELVEMAMSEAEKMIRTKIAQDDQDRLIHNYMSQLASAQSGS